MERHHPVTRPRTTDHWVQRLVAESQLSHAKGPLIHLARTTAAPDVGCPPCPTLNRHRLSLCVLQCYQFTFIYSQYSHQNWQNPAAASEQSSHPCSGRKNFPQQGQLEGQRGDRHSHPSASHSHLWVAAFDLSGPKFQWVHLPLSSAFSKAEQQVILLNVVVCVIHDHQEHINYIGFEFFWDAPARTDSWVSPQTLLK